MGPDHDLAPEVQQAIADISCRRLEDMFCAPIEDIEQWRTQISNTLQSDGSEVIGLTADDLITLVELYGEELDLQFNSDISSLRLSIENLAVQVLHHLSQEQVQEAINSLDDFMLQYGFAISDLRGDNHLAHLTHEAERIDGNCRIYRYRIDGLVIDVHEVTLCNTRVYFFRKQS